jgi:hypothetical protein
MYDAIMRLKSISFNRIFNRTQNCCKPFIYRGKKFKKKLRLKVEKLSIAYFNRKGEKSIPSNPNLMVRYVLFYPVCIGLVLTLTHISGEGS